MKIITITVELDARLYDEAKKVLADIGYTMEEALILFFEETVRLGRIPFEYTEQDIEEARALNTRLTYDICDV